MARLRLRLRRDLGRQLQVRDRVHAHGDAGLLAEGLGLPAELVVGGRDEVVPREEGQLALLGEGGSAIEGGEREAGDCAGRGLQEAATTDPSGHAAGSFQIRKRSRAARPWESEAVLLRGALLVKAPHLSVQVSRVVRLSGRAQAAGRLATRNVKSALLHDLAVLVDDLTLLDDHPTLAHRALHRGARAAVDGVPHPHRMEHLPLEAHEGQHGQRRLVHAPAKPGRQAERQQLGHQARLAESSWLIPA